MIGWVIQYRYAQIENNHMCINITIDLSEWAKSILERHL